MCMLALRGFPEVFRHPHRAGGGALVWEERISEPRGEIPGFGFREEPGFHDPLPSIALAHHGWSETGQAFHLVAEREPVWVAELTTDRE